MNSNTGYYSFTVFVPDDAFEVENYSSVSSNALKLNTVKDIVNAENLDASYYYYDYANIVIDQNESVTYGIKQEKLVLKIKEVKESKHWSWFSWSNYEIASISHFYVIHKNHTPFLRFN